MKITLWYHTGVERCGMNSALAKQQATFNWMSLSLVGWARGVWRSILFPHALFLREERGLGLGCTSELQLGEEQLFKQQKRCQLLARSRKHSKESWVCRYTLRVDIFIRKASAWDILKPFILKGTRKKWSTVIEMFDCALKWGYHNTWLILLESFCNCSAYTNCFKIYCAVKKSH